MVVYRLVINKYINKDYTHNSYGFKFNNIICRTHDTTFIKLFIFFIKSSNLIGEKSNLYKFENHVNFNIFLLKVSLYIHKKTAQPYFHKKKILNIF